MYKKIILVVLGLVLIPSLTSAAIFCPNLTENMKQGYCDQNLDDADCAQHITGDQVSQLQRFLKEYFNNPVGLWVSGYFGGKTKQYVMQFQDQWDLPAFGNVFGLTRAAIAQACATTTPPTQPPPTQPPPEGDLNYYWDAGAWGSCISGQQTRTIQCRNFAGIPVSDSYCPQPKLATVRSCTVPPEGASCTAPWGATIANGQSVPAYNTVELQTYPPQTICVLQTRTCSNGILSGSYQNQSCSIGGTPQAYSWQVGEWGQCSDYSQQSRTVQCKSSTGAVVADSNCSGTKPATTQSCSGVPISNSSSCTFNGLTLLHGSSVTAYQSSTVSSGQTCVSQTRTCSNGSLSGSYGYATCVGVSVPLTNAPCSWNGQTVAHGSSVSAYLASSVASGQSCTSQTRTCSNGTLSGSYAYASCSVQPAPSGTATITATPSSGAAPLSVTFNASGFPNNVWGNTPLTLHFGDGQSSPTGSVCQASGSCMFYNIAHTYQSPGTYVAKVFSNSNGTGTLLMQTTVTVTVTGSNSTPISGATLVPASNGGYTTSSGMAPFAIVLRGTVTASGTVHPSRVIFDFGDGSSMVPLDAAYQGGTPTNSFFSSTNGPVLTPQHNPHYYNTPGTYTAKLLVDGVVRATLPITVTGSNPGNPSTGTATCTYSDITGNSTIECPAIVTSVVAHCKKWYVYRMPGMGGYCSRTTTGGHATCALTPAQSTSPTSSATCTEYFPTASTQNSSQLAAALTALESILKQMLALLK